MHRHVGGCGIYGLGMYVPEKILNNADLEKMVDTSDSWIVERSGIRERRIAQADQNTTDLSVPAAKMAMEQAGVKAEEIDLIVLCTNNPDTHIPAGACVLQNKLGAVNAAAFDLVSGCSGFVYGLAVAGQFAMNRTYKTILVVAADILSRITDWTDRSTCVLFGDGAGAAVLRPSVEGHGILTFRLGCDGSRAGDIIMPAGGSSIPSSHASVDKRLHYLKMNGPEVFRFAVRVIEDVAGEVLSSAGYSVQDLSLFVPHQANMRIIEASAKRIGIGMEKVAVNVDRYGNTSSASVAMALYEAERQGRIKRDDLIMLVGFGAGMTYAGMLIRW